MSKNLPFNSLEKPHFHKFVNFGLLIASGGASLLINFIPDLHARQNYKLCLAMYKYFESRANLSEEELNNYSDSDRKTYEKNVSIAEAFAETRFLDDSNKIKASPEIIATKLLFTLEQMYFKYKGQDVARLLSSVLSILSGVWIHSLGILPENIYSQRLEEFGNAEVLYNYRNLSEEPRSLKSGVFEPTERTTIELANKIHFLGKGFRDSTKDIPFAGDSRNSPKTVNFSINNPNSKDVSGYYIDKASGLHSFDQDPHVRNRSYTSLNQVDRRIKFSDFSRLQLAQMFVRDRLAIDPILSEEAYKQLFIDAVNPFQDKGITMVRLELNIKNHLSIKSAFVMEGFKYDTLMGPNKI